MTVYKKQPYKIDIFNEGDEFDILYYLGLNGFIFYLDVIQKGFNELHIPNIGVNQHVYFIAQQNFEAVKVGLANDPYKRLRSLQTGNPNKLILLYFYDCMEKQKEIEDIPMFKSCMVNSPHEGERKDFMRMGGRPQLSGEWFKPDDRAFRILIRKGFEIINWYKSIELKGVKDDDKSI